MNRRFVRVIDSGVIEQADSGDGPWVESGERAVIVDGKTSKEARLTFEVPTATDFDRFQTFAARVGLDVIDLSWVGYRCYGRCRLIDGVEFSR